MLNNLYILKIPDNNILKKLIRYHICFHKITYYDNYILVTVDYLNYANILRYMKIFNIELVSVKGLKHYKYLLKKYFIFLISAILGFIWLIFLSNIIFDVRIVTNDKEIAQILNLELNYYNIRKYKRVVSFKEKERIKNNIIKDNKDKIEWLELTKSGSVYIVNVERRIINDLKDDNKKVNVIAKKNAFIIDIMASSGSVVKKVNDYVKKGDVIVSGEIKKNDTIMNYVKASALVYGETWYDVKVILPINYHDIVYTGKMKKRITINLFNKKIKLFNINNYDKEEIKEHILIENKLIPFSINYDTFYEIRKNTDLLTDEKIWDIGFNIARSNLLNSLDKGSKILTQKKLKKEMKDSKIELDIFIKVYENITDYEEIIVGE